MVMLAAGRAGMVGQDAQFRADRQIWRHRGSSRPCRDDAVLLIRLEHHEIRIWGAVDIANQAEELVDRLAARVAVARHCHPSGIDDDPTLLGIAVGHGGQHAHRDVIGGADANACPAKPIDGN